MGAHPFSEDFHNMRLLFWRNAWQVLARVWVTAFSMGQFIFFVQVYFEPLPIFFRLFHNVCMFVVFGFFSDVDRHGLLMTTRGCLLHLFRF